MHMGDSRLLLVTYLAKPESVARTVFLDIEPMLPYPSRPRPASVFAYREPWKAVPIETFVANIIDRERWIFAIPQRSIGAVLFGRTYPALLLAACFCMFFQVFFEGMPVFSMFDTRVLLNPFVNVLLMHLFATMCPANNLVLV